MAVEIVVPSFEFSGFYYPEILEDLIQYLRTDVPEITDESPEEPFIQLLRAFALTGHLSNVLLDITANERFLPTAKLRASVGAILALIDVRLAQANPASADELIELSQVLTATTTTIPASSKFATEETETTSAIDFETLTAVTTQRTDQVGKVFGYKASGPTWYDHTTEAISSTGSFNIWSGAPAAGDVLYIGHPDILWDLTKFNTAVASAGGTIAGVWEFYDGDFEDGEPDTVLNTGLALQLDLNGILGTASRAGTIIRVRCISTGAFEDLTVVFSGGFNRVTTSGFLGQTSPSTSSQDYLVGSDWKELKGQSDATVQFSVIGEKDFSYTLPQTVTEDWKKTSIGPSGGEVSAYWIRFRVILVVGPTAVSITQVRIDTGKQYQVFSVTQGESQEDSPLGSSTGLADQSFQLLQFPVLDDATLRVFVTETVEEEWARVTDFLASTSADKHFRVEFDDEGRCEVFFGNGVNGKIPTLGVDNIRALYRTMESLDGNVGQNTINVNKSGVAFVNKAYNPRAAAGFKVAEGSTPEDLARVKIAGPATLRTKDRAVTTEDIETLAVSYEGSDGNSPVARALVIEEAFGPKTAELVMVGAGGAVLTGAQLTAVQEVFNGNPATKVKGKLVLNHQVTANNYTPHVISVVATVYGGNLTAIKTALTALLSPVALDIDGVTFIWEFGGEVPVSRINAAIFDTTPRPRKVVITTPSGDVTLATKELPTVGTLTITVNP